MARKRNNETPLEGELIESTLEEREEFEIEVIKDYKGLIFGEKQTVSGNVANALISKGIAKLSE